MDDPLYDELRDKMFIEGISKGADQATDISAVIPYLEGLDEALQTAKQWFSAPPPALETGLRQLASGEIPENLSMVMELYGDC